MCIVRREERESKRRECEVCIHYDWLPCICQKTPDTYMYMYMYALLTEIIIQLNFYQLIILNYLGFPLNAPQPQLPIATAILCQLGRSEVV